MRIVSIIAVLLLTAVWTWPEPASAQRRNAISLIRDAEIENTIRSFSAPLFEAAGLDPQAVQVHLVNDNSINAFVAGGQRLFINTGLLTRVRTPAELKGVIAHETGHIAGGHLARLQDELRAATAQSILAMVLGAAAAVAGAPGAGQAIMMGGTSVAERSLLQYTRTQESAADQAAIGFLEQTGQTGRGLVSFLELLGDQEALLAQRQDPYVRTHPVSRERVSALLSRVERSAFYNRPDPPADIALLMRIRAKLVGFIDAPGAALQRYPATDTSQAARYARAVAYYRIPDLNRALPEVDGLLAETPDDPYFLELKAQMLFENGRVAEAVPVAERMAAIAPREPLLRFMAGQILNAQDSPEASKAAIEHLEYAARHDPEYSPAWRQLAIAYGRTGDRGRAAYASAERFLIEGNKRDARGQANIALRILPAGSPAWLRANDILNSTDQDEDRDRDPRDRRR